MTEDIETAPEAEVIPLDKLVAIHAKIKAKQAQLDKALADLEEQREEIRLAIKDQMKALGLTSVKTSSGTVSLMKSTRYNTQDWDSFKAFVLEHQVVDLLEKRIAQSNMAQFLEENPGVVPPGLNSTTGFDIRVTPIRK
jgi:glutamate/tyrosine decarboxylase-like PLP-dependent enzyme